MNVRACPIMPAGREGEESVKGAIIGGGIGMIGGALFGGLLGHPVEGAMVGATAVGVAGGVGQGMNAEQRCIHSLSKLYAQSSP